MDDFESRLEQELSSLGRVPLAEPVPVADLHRRARRVRIGHAVTGGVAVVTAALLVMGVVVATHNGSSSPLTPHSLRVSAPGFVLGDIDAVVLSSKFDGDGARDPLPPALAQTVAHIAGVQSVSGVLDTFAPVVQGTELNGGVDGGVSYGGGVNGAAASSGNATTTPPRTPIVFSYHQPNEVRVLSGRLPKSGNEIVVDADFLSREKVGLGDSIHLRIRDAVTRFDVVGTFDLPGVDLTGIPLVSLPAALQSPDLYVDRLDVKLAPGADAADVRDAIAVAVGSDYTIAPPSEISFPDQRLAQVEIQHAYWALLSPDSAERSTSGVGPPTAQEHSNYEKYAGLAQVVELRVENVSFLSPDAAALTYRIYYEGSPSPVIQEPQIGSATRVNGHWQLGTNTLCSLAALVGISCKGTSNVTITPPNGYQPLSTLDPEIEQAFDALADPNATVAERTAAILDGGKVIAVIEHGVSIDQQYAGKTTLSIAGWKTTGPSTVDVLYSLQTVNGPSTPWPSVAEAQRGPDGHWYMGAGFACGITAIAGSGGCDTFSVPPSGVIGTTATTAVSGASQTPLTAAVTTPANPAPTTSP